MKREFVGVDGRHSPHTLARLTKHGSHLFVGSEVGTGEEDRGSVFAVTSTLLYGKSKKKKRVEIGREVVVVIGDTEYVVEGQRELKDY